MGFWSDITGRTQAKAAKRAGEAVIGGLEGSKDVWEQERGQQKSLFNPYIDRGAQASDLYASRLGAFGPDRQSSAMASFQPSIGLNYLNKYNLDQLGQSRAMGGGLRSGKTQLAAQEILQRNLLQDYWRQMQGLGGLGDQGYSALSNLASARRGIAGNLAGIEESMGTARGGALMGAANSRAQGSANIFNAGVGLFGSAIGAFGGMPSGRGAPRGNNYLASVGYAPQDYNLPWRRGA